MERLNQAEATRALAPRRFRRSPRAHRGEGRAKYIALGTLFTIISDRFAPEATQGFRDPGLSNFARNGSWGRPRGAKNILVGPLT